MTSRKTRAIAESQFGDEMLDRQAVLDGLRRELPPARDPSSLVEEAAIFGLGPGRVALDIGSGRGEWSARLAERFGCTSVAFDVSRSRLRDARERGLPVVRADGDGLPVRSGAVDVVWCRDTLEMFEDPVAALREFARVLVPGGGCVLYLPVPTELLEAGERAEMLAGRETAKWWIGGRGAVDDAIRAAGFSVLNFSITSPEYTESVLGRDPAAVVAQLLEHAQLRRGRVAMEAAVGAAWYQSFLTWSRWQMYLLLGKLESGLWLLRAPS